MTADFTSVQQVRFADCDPAGIAYYPRCLELCDAAVEDWTEAVLGMSRKRMHLEMGLGLPSVDLQASFPRACELGDRLEFEVAVLRTGRSSVSLECVARTGAEPRFRAALVLVLMDLAERRSRAWPDEWHRRLLAHVRPQPILP